MKILPLATDSIGTRSMATFVDTEDIKIFIDPGKPVEMLEARRKELYKKISGNEDNY